MRLARKVPWDDFISFQKIHCYSSVGGAGMQSKLIPEELLSSAISKVESKYDKLPFTSRKITISKLLIVSTLEILNEEKTKTLPQNARHNCAKDTPDGLDKRLKIRMGSDTCRAHIISDILTDAGVVRVFKTINPKTGKSINATQLISDYIWN
jgi:hypothetical protein